METPTIDGPVWTDACEHGREHYIASFMVAKIMHHTRTVYHETFDLYLFPQKHYGTEVCLRFGDEPHQYASPGPLHEFMARRRYASDEYTRAIDIINELGLVKSYFERTKPKPQKKGNKCQQDQSTCNV